MFERFFEKLITIVIVAIAIIPVAYLVGIGAIWAVMPDLTADTITKYVPIGIAIGAFLFSILQGWQNREHNRLSVRPLLAFDEITSIEVNVNNAKFYLINAGVGPAIIKNVDLIFDDKVVSSNDYKTYNSFLRNDIGRFIKGEIRYAPRDDVISVGQKQLMWTLQYRNTKEDIETVNKLRLRIEYQSIYKGKVFIFDTKDFQDFHNKKFI